MLIKGFLASYGDATHFFASFPTFEILESLCEGTERTDFTRRPLSEVGSVVLGLLRLTG